jgi:hypothetical protein
MNGVHPWAILTELADGRVERPKRLTVRFSKPVLPDQDISTDSTDIYPGSPIAGRTSYRYVSYRYETYRYETSADGAPVLTDGLAEIEEH